MSLIGEVGDGFFYRIYKKSNNFQFSDQDREGSSVEEESLDNLTGTSAGSSKSEANDHDQFYSNFSITDTLNTIDYSTIADPSMDGAESFDDGSNNLSRKLKLPSDSSCNQSHSGHLAARAATTTSRLWTRLAFSIAA